MSSPTISFSLDECEGSIQDRFERVVCQAPDHLAVKTSANSYTYQALNEKANLIARTLIKAGGKPGEPVALLLDFGVDTVAAILGILKAGMVYIVLDPALPVVRLQSILEHARVDYFLSDSQDLPLAGKINPKGKPLINLDTLDGDANKANLELKVEPSSPAAIYYTSGTTGEPKGILRNHREIIYRGWTYSDLYQVSIDDTISQVFSFSFAASTSDMFGTLLNGAALCLYNIRRSTPLETVEWLVAEGITIFHPPVALFRLMLDRLTGEVKFPKLRMIQLGGAPLFKRDVERSRMFFPPTCILNNRFASTEAGLIASFMIDHETRLPGDTVPIGYPVAGMDVFLVDDAGKLVGPNEVGEIAVRSRYLSPDTWLDQQNTRERFSLAAPDGEGFLYLTGDLGRADSDGCLEHLGRRDSVVKVRGYRVDTNEIELALREVSEIRDVFVTTRPVPYAPQEEHIIAYIVLLPDKPVTPHTLRGFLAKRLPSYKLPARFIFLDALPLNPNGKVDARALPDPSRENNETR